MIQRKLQAWTGRERIFRREAIMQPPRTSCAIRADLRAYAIALASSGKITTRTIDSFTRLVILGADLEEQTRACRLDLPHLGGQGSQLRS
jgi:hypothetical protein